MTALVDEEVACYLVASALHKSWKHAFRDEQETLAQVEAYQGEEDSYGAKVKQQFLDQYRAAKDLEIPQGYAFKYPCRRRAPSRNSSSAPPTATSPR